MPAPVLLLALALAAGLLLSGCLAPKARPGAAPPRAPAAAAEVETPAPPPDPGTPLLLGVPDVEQAEDYSCGPSALRAVLGYYGIVADERLLTAEAKTAEESGAEPGELAASAARRGLEPAWREGLSLDDLAREAAGGNPVLVLGQAWPEGPRPAWKDTWDAGHYMVVIGIDARAVYLEDPSLAGARGAIPRAEFLERWHCWRSDEEKALRQGMLFRKPGRPPPARPAGSSAGPTRWVKVE